VWQIPKAVIDEIRVAKPELFYRMAGRVARRLSARLRAAGEQLSGGAAPVIATWHMEHDLLANVSYPTQPTTASKPCEAWRTFRSPEFR
jgi:aspartate ammonia-lyase